MTIDTACSSSLVALHQAVQTLRQGESKVAVVGGTNLILGPEVYMAESQLRMLSPTGRSRMVCDFPTLAHVLFLYSIVFIKQFHFGI